MTKTITPKNRSSKQKSGEILRFLMFMDVEKLQVDDIAEKTGVSKRTITHCIYDGNSLGGKLLRGLHSNYGVSIDWLLSGTGHMTAPTNEIAEPEAKYSSSNPRTTRMIAFIQDWMTYANEDEQAWLETELKFNLKQYQKFLEKNDG